MIFVNFKTYEEGSGERALSLARVLEEVSKQTKVPIIPAVQAVDLKEIVSSVSIPVWVQNIDPVTYGAHTGATLPEEVVRIGAKGTLLNHSEHKFFNFEDLKKAYEAARAQGLKILIFAKDTEELASVCELHPDFVSYEPPELIGSTKTSVSQAHPDVIAKAVSIAAPLSIPLIVGAGVHSREDVAKSIQLGASGIAVATDIVKAQDPKSELLDLLEGFKK